LSDTSFFREFDLRDFIDSFSFLRVSFNSHNTDVDDATFFVKPIGEKRNNIINETIKIANEIKNTADFHTNGSISK
jgi:hypothetical protein